MSKPVVKFIDAVLQNFPPYRWDEEQEKAWAATMVRELGGFSDEVLSRATTDMLRTRKDRRIPLAADCINACLDARRWLEAKQGAENLPIHHQKPKSYDERTQLANDLVMGPEGRMAAKEGWIGTLHDYARNHGRLPPASEFGSLKRQAKEFDEAYAKVVRREGMAGFGSVGRHAGSLLEGLGSKMLKKRNDLADMVLKGAGR